MSAVTTVLREIAIEMGDRTITFPRGELIRDQKIAIAIVRQQYSLLAAEALERDPQQDRERLGAYAITLYQDESGALRYADCKVTHAEDFAALTDALYAMSGSRETDRFKLSLLVPLHLKFHGS